MKKILVLACALLACAFLVRTARADDSDVAGKWHFVLDTPGGDREVDANFAVDSGKVTGKWGTTDVAGTFTDGKLDLSFPMTSEESGDSGELKITGVLKDDALTGNWEFTSYNGTYKATRVK